MNDLEAPPLPAPLIEQQQHRPPSLPPCIYCGRRNHSSTRCRLLPRLCKNFANNKCYFKRNCKFVHPLCPYGTYCDDIDCNYYHSPHYNTVRSPWITLDCCLRQCIPPCPVELRKLIKSFLSLDNITIRQAKEKDYGPISDWVTSAVTDMSNLFANNEEFNGNISDWDVSSVTTMHCMFYNCHAFNQPLNQWDVSNVVNMHGMFRRTVAFNQPLDQWEMKQHIENPCNTMFSLTSNWWRSPLDKWRDWYIVKPSRLSLWTVLDCCCSKQYHIPIELRSIIRSYLILDNVTIREAVALWRQGIQEDPLHQCSVQRYGPISEWLTSYVTDMSSLFADDELFNENIEQWDVSNVVDMKYMFYNAKAFNQPLNRWNIEKLQNIRGMFTGASAFNQPLSGKWDTLGDL